MKILIACERSGRVRDAFSARGHDAVSCDLKPSDTPGKHIIGDVIEQLDCSFDMLIGFPECRYLSRAGSRWNKVQPDRVARTEVALAFFMALWNAPIPLIALENPIGVVWQRLRPPDQVIEPYMFGEPFKKATCLWLKGLPPLMATSICSEYQVNWTEKAHRSARLRSITFQGIALAMASQWG